MSSLRKLVVFMGERRVGTLAETNRREIYFEYSPEWLLEGFSISPYFVPFTPGLKREDTLIFEGLLGVFDDSLPDGWGRLLTDRHFRKLGIPPESLTPIDRLTHIGARGAGALRYEPADPHSSEGIGALDLAEVATQSERIVAGSPEDALPELRAAGGASGGSRPKVVVAFDPSTGKITSDLLNPPPGSEHWLVKFRAREDLPDAGPIEAAYADMARAAGVVLPPTRLFDTKAGRFFGIRRFDRGPKGERIHTHSFGGLVHSDFRHPNRDYQEFLSVVQDLTRDFTCVEQAFRRAAFNVFAHNRDDHVRNHAFLADGKGNWSLSPAYDLTFSTGVNGQHNMTVANRGVPKKQDLLELAMNAGIGSGKAKEVIGQVEEIVSRWSTFAEKAEVRSDSLKNINSALKSL